MENVPVKEKYVFQIAQSEEEAYEMYCEYAHTIGFSVRKEHRLLWPGTNILKQREYCCTRAGVKKAPKVPDSLAKYRRLDARTNCPAVIIFKADKDGKNLTVGKFIEEHNHELADNKNQHFLRSCRFVSIEKGVVLKSMNEAGIKTSVAYDYLADEVGGSQNVGFSKKDAYNFIDKERRSRIDGGDAENLLQLLKERATNDNMYSYEVQVDDYNRLTNFIWMDGQGKIDYECFGDVVTFDSTYRMNKYNLACAPFVVVNHHWHNVVVAIAFLSQETIESFTWVFETFLKFVAGKKPITFFTDQDQAMAAAIEKVLPSTNHRLCQWHIAKKAPTKVPAFNGDSTLRSLFYNCLSKCDTADEFEVRWSEMLCRGSLFDNRWLSDLYKIKQKWATGFNKTVMDHGMLSTQRSESTNNVCHLITKATDTLVDCFLQLEKMIVKASEKGKEEDFKCKHGSIPTNARNCPLLKQASKVYTRVMYAKFYEEFKQSAFGLFVVEELPISENSQMIVVRWNDCAENNKHWYIMLDINNYDVSCSCHKFETFGMLCSHALKAYSHKNITAIPNKFILKRWTVHARKDLYLQTDSIGGEESSGLIFRNNISRYAYDLALRVEKCEEARNYVIDGLRKISSHADSILEETSKVDGNMPKHDIKDPPKLRPKGISNARLKSHWEVKRKPKRQGENNKKAEKVEVKEERVVVKEEKLEISDSMFSFPEIPDTFTCTAFDYYQ